MQEPVTGEIGNMDMAKAPPPAVLEPEIVEDGPKPKVIESVDLKTQKVLLTIQTEVDCLLLEKERAEGSAARKYYEIGEQLAKAKAAIPHGEYERWLKEIWGGRYASSTLNAYSGIYEAFKGSPHIVEAYDFTLLQKMKARTFPEAFRELIIENPQDWDAATVKGLVYELENYDAGKTSRDEFCKLAEKQLALGKKRRDGQDLLRDSERNKRVVRYGIASLMSKFKDLLKAILKYTPMSRENAPPLGDRFYNDLINLIDDLIAGLEKLKACLIRPAGLLEQRLTMTKDGVVDVEHVIVEGPKGLPGPEPVALPLNSGE